jgi:hypothetical protein
VWIGTIIERHAGLVMDPQFAEPLTFGFERLRARRSEIDRFRRTRLPRPTRGRQALRRVHVNDGKRQSWRAAYTNE